jgi:gliding motility-associated-like protein
MDEKLRHILNDKLDAYESKVPDHLWSNVKGSASGGVVTSIKVLIASLSAAAVIGVSYWLFPLSESQSVAEEAKPIPAVELPSPPANDSLSAEKSGQTIILKQLQYPVEVIAPQEVMTGASMAHVTAPEISKTERTVTVAEYTNYPSEKPVDSPQQQASKPLSSFTAVPVNNGQSSLFFMPSNPKAENYHWDFGDNEQSDELSPLHTYDEPGIYTVVLTSTTNQQTNTCTLEVECLPEPKWYVPTIFTPNNDGKNDAFDLMAQSKYITPLELQIFNETGKLLFTSPQSGVWDGLTSDNQEAPSGNYLFKFVGYNLRHQLVEKSGFIRLQR